MPGPVSAQRLLHVILGSIVLIGLFGFLYLVDSVIADILGHLG